ncbi:adhesin [Mycoplasma flocculare]|uniref:Adhesin n=1 Tax=Mesomycoplasma flocculare TaxID=2128 RepID=A0AAW9XBK4_MESFC|nr:adhesin [Mesomycoplasma flocculare]MXR56614.1 adhesin [Mesomycoplasma flocculare]
MAKSKNPIVMTATAITGIAVFATTIGLVTRISYTGKNPRAELESLVSRVKHVAFKSDVFDNSTTYKQIKEMLFDETGKLKAGIDLKKFVSFYTTVNSRIHKFDPNFTPNRPFLEFINLIPNDEDESFEIQFRAKHQIDNNYTAYSNILSKKISFVQRSQFALADFNANLEKITKSFEANIQNLRKKDLSSNFASENLAIISQKIPFLTRVEDFAKDINKSGTQEEAIKRISQYFPDFQKLIYELNDDNNNKLPFKKGKIFAFSLEKHAGTNNFITLSADLEPSFLVKAELTNEAKFELKDLNIQEIQMLEKIKLVPSSKTEPEKSQQTETKKENEVKPEANEIAAQNPTPETTKTVHIASKKPSYFADIDEILSNISIRKLKLSDFKITAKEVTIQSNTTPTSSPPAAVAPSQSGSQPTQATSASPSPSSTSGTSTPQAKPENKKPQLPATQTAKPQGEKPEILPNYFEIYQQKADEFLTEINKKFYQSNQAKSDAVVSKINSQFLINPISLDFGKLSPYFKKSNPEGVSYLFDIANAEIKEENEKTSLAIPVTISIFSSFFGDFNEKLLKQKHDIFVLPNFKTDMQKGSKNQVPQPSLDKDKQTYYLVKSLTKFSEPSQESGKTSENSENSEVKILSSTGYISKQELEALIEQSKKAEARASEPELKKVKVARSLKDTNNQEQTTTTPTANNHGKNQNSQESQPKPSPAPEKKGEKPQPEPFLEPKYDEIREIIANPFQYGYNFGANEAMLNAWVGKQVFPSPKDFADFKQNNSISSEYQIKSLKSDKFFENDYDVAAFYAYLVQLDPARVLEYFYEIAKANNLIDPSTQLDMQNVKEGNVFFEAEKIKLKTTDQNPVYALDFNSQVLNFDLRGWISNLYLPKNLIDNKINPATEGLNDAKIFGKLSEQNANTELFKQLKESLEKIQKTFKDASASILKESSSSNTNSHSQSSNGLSLTDTKDSEIKKFFKEKTQNFRDLRDVLLAFYYKAKQMNNFSAWKKIGIGNNLDYKIIFEKYNNNSQNSHSNAIPDGVEEYKLVYYYKIFNTKTKKDLYQTPKTTLNLYLSKTPTRTEEYKAKQELNKAILSIPYSYSVFYLKKDQFDKIEDKPQTPPNSNKNGFEQTEGFKKIQQHVASFNKDFEVSVASQKKDPFNPDRIKIVNLQVKPKTIPSKEGKAVVTKNSALQFQVKIILDSDSENPQTTQTQSTGEAKSTK